MYAPPPAVVAPAPRRGGLAASGPLLAICCLLFILFLIASTIILALIPVYLSRRDTNPVGNTPTYTAVMDPQNGATPSQGTLTGNSINNINDANNKALGLPTGSFIGQTARSAPDSGKRKRRGFGLVRERRASPKTYCLFSFNRRRCQQCGTSRFQNSIKPFFITITIFTLTLTGTIEPQTITFLVTIIFSQITIPPFIGPGSGPGTITGRLAG